MTTNRLLAPGDSVLTGANITQRRMRYDAAGNMTVDSYTGSGQRTYDAENRLTAAVGGENATWQTYGYDGNGMRVKRTVNGSEIWQVFGVGGELVAEYFAESNPANPGKEYSYRNGQLLITAEPPTVTGAAPAGLSASPSVSNVALSWTAASGATKYRIERKENGSGYTFAGTSTATNFSDTDVDEDKAYLYKVCAANTQNNCTSGYSNFVLAETTGFTDPTIISLSEDPTGVNVTKVKAQHINDLRIAVNAVRILAGLSWSTPNTTAGSLIRVEHVRDLRQDLGAALTLLGIQLPTYTDPVLKGFSEDTLNATVIKAAHIRELRLASTRGAGSGGGGTGSSTPQIHWLVSDQLGSPRMIFDVTGSFTSVSRHDYLPFGEELTAGGRTTGNGYTNNDGTRQKFTQKERDEETGLDYFGARYYSSVAGRFTSPDQPFADQDVADPQSWNLYSYVRNKPLRFVDPLGLWHVRSDDGDDIIYEADLGDHDLSGLAELLGVPLQSLVNFYGSKIAGSVKPGMLLLFSQKAWNHFTGNPQETSEAQQQSQDVARWKQQLRDDIVFARIQIDGWRRYGPIAGDATELKALVKAYVERRCHCQTVVAGTTSSTGQVTVTQDENPYRTEATRRHEEVHRQTTERGHRMYGSGAAFDRWWYNPRNWVADEIKAYSTEIRYMQQVLRRLR